MFFRAGCVTNPLRVAVTAAETAAVREPLGVSETLVFDTWPRESSSAIVAALNGFPRAQFPRGCVTNPLRIAVTATETAAFRESLGVSETLVFDTLKCPNLNKQRIFH